MADYRALRQRYSLLRDLRRARAGRRRDAAASRCHRRGRGDPLFRSAAALHADGSRVRLRQGRRDRRSNTRFARPPTSDRAAALSISRERLGHVLETIRLLKRELAAQGSVDRVRRRALHDGGVRDRGRALRPATHRTKAFMYAQPAAWHTPLRPLCHGDGASTCVAQVAAGAQAIQVFDSWVGAALPRGLPRVRPAAHAGAIFHGSAASCRPFISASPAAPSCTQCPPRSGR